MAQGAGVHPGGAAARRVHRRVPQGVRPTLEEALAHATRQRDAPLHQFHCTVNESVEPHTDGGDLDGSFIAWAAFGVWRTARRGAGGRRRQRATAWNPRVGVVRQWKWRDRGAAGCGRPALATARAGRARGPRARARARPRPVAPKTRGRLRAPARPAAAVRAVEQARARAPPARGGRRGARRVRRRAPKRAPPLPVRSWQVILRHNYM